MLWWEAALLFHRRRRRDQKAHLYSVDVTDFTSLGRVMSRAHLYGGVTRNRVVTQPIAAGRRPPSSTRERPAADTKRGQKRGGMVGAAGFEPATS